MRAGEILGIGGLVGAGRTEVLESILGIRKRASGQVLVSGAPISTIREAMGHGVTLLTEERRETGIFPLMDIRWNSVASSLDKVCSALGLVSMGKVEKNTQWAIDSLRIKTASQKTLISNLSGGNQQKVLMGRCLLNEPQVLLLDEPTRGIDVGAKYEIYQLMVDLAKRGKTIVFVSSEMPELIGISDNGHGHVTKMHTDERAANIQPRMGADMLDRHGILHLRIHRRGKRTACMGLRQDADDVVAVFFRTIALNDQSAVEMLAALGGEINPLLCQHGCDACKNGLSRLG